MAGGSRFQQKQQKRRQNGVLNIAIAIVLILVAIVSYQLFVPERKEQASSSDKKAAQQTTKENRWFAGYFPYENPRYALVVVDIETNSNGNKVTPIFKAIVESIYRLEIEK